MFKKIVNFAAKVGFSLIESHTTGPMILAITTGLAAGLVAVAFHKLILLFHQAFFENLGGILGSLGDYRVILIPAAGGLLAGPLITFWAKEAKGHGVPEVMQAIALKGGRIRPRVAVVKSLASALTIGSGGSVGREGPIVQVGSTIGSALGQLMKLPDQRIRMLVASGAAGGISAVFGAPIAGAIFALEVILGELSARSVGPVVLASVTANIVSRAIVGNKPAYDVPAYFLRTPYEMPLYLLLGVVAAFVGILFIIALYKMEDIWDGWKIPDYWKPAIGGIFVGIVVFFYPETLGTGHHPMEQALHGNIVFSLMAILLIMKLIATCFTLGSGASGGVFAPALYMGTMLGGTFGTVANKLFPNVAGPVGAYAVVGMAAVFAGAAHAPMTSLLIVFEMTNDYNIILPLMTAVVTSTLISQWVHRESIYTLKLKRKGIDIHAGKTVNLMNTIMVSEAMTEDFETVSDKMPVKELAKIFSKSAHHGFPVVDKNNDLRGIVTLADLADNMEDYDAATLVEDIMTKRLLVVHPDETLEEALKRFGTKDIGRLPVVDRANPRRLLGLLRRGDIISTYSRTALKHAEVMARAQQLKVETGPEARFIEFEVRDDSASAEKLIRELVLPPEAILVSIHRDGKIVIPHGKTIIRPGDRVVALAKQSDADSLKMAIVG